MEQENNEEINESYTEDYTEKLNNEKNIAVAIIGESGKVVWYLSDTITDSQADTFQKIAVVSEKPSFILLALLKLEIFLLGLTLWIENKFKKGK